MLSESDCDMQGKSMCEKVQSESIKMSFCQIVNLSIKNWILFQFLFQFLFQLLFQFLFLYQEARIAAWIKLS